MARGEVGKLPRVVPAKAENPHFRPVDDGKAQTASRRGEPERTCIGCRERSPQQSLIRVLKERDASCVERSRDDSPLDASNSETSGEQHCWQSHWIVLPPTESETAAREARVKRKGADRAGRSVYFHVNFQCVKNGCNSKRLSRALRQKISERCAEELREQIIN
ncbi:MAG: YlxR family protein [Bdellovibrionales bacterium]|nr:YlxR family protein [Bdellovibrionales bacterium]